MANDTDPNGSPSSLSRTGVSNPSPASRAGATVGYNAGVVTFTPPNKYTGSASFVDTITNGFGTDSAIVSLTVNPAGPTTSSLFSPNGTPATVTENDGVYAYCITSTFPTNSYQASNYWVDVVFQQS